MPGKRSAEEEASVEGMDFTISEMRRCRAWHARFWLGEVRTEREKDVSI
jgi:hypothetical protein